MAITVTIDGVAKEIRNNTLEISASINGRHTMSCEVLSLAGTYRPAIDDEIVIADGATTLFGGVIDTPTELGFGGVGLTAIVTRISAVDFNSFADRRYVSIAFTAATTLEGAIDALDDYLTPYGVAKDAAQVTGPALGVALSYSYVKLTDIFNELATLTGYVWEIDYTKTLRFYLPSASAAPFNLTATNGYARGDITVELSRRDYANRIIVFAGGNGTRHLESGADGNRYFGDGTTSGSFRYWDFNPPGILIDYPFNGLLVISRSGVPEYGQLGVYGVEDTPYQYSNGKAEPFRRAVLALTPGNFWPLSDPTGTVARDLIGSDAGTIAGSPTMGVEIEAAPNWRGIAFDGVNDRITFTGVAASTTTYTVLLMLTPDSSQVDNDGVLFSGAGGVDLCYKQSGSTGKINLIYSAADHLSSTNLVDAVRVFVAVVVSGGSGTFYINCVADGTFTSATTFTPDSIGSDGTKDLKAQVLSDVAYWPGVALTLAQLQTIYATLNGPHETRIYQKTSETAVAANDYITAEYTGQYPIIAQADDSAEQAANGLWETVVPEPDVVSSTVAQALADAYLDESAVTTKTARYVTWDAGLKPGQSQTITVAPRNLSGTFVLTEIQTRTVDQLIIRHVTAIEGTRFTGSWRDTYRAWGAASSSGGSVGAAGSAGAAGAEGPAGPTGATGATGAAGATGATGAAGATGATGATGAAGAAATIAVGTVTTGAPGSAATVTNVGSSSAAVFNFSIPEGTEGVQGDAGQDCDEEDCIP